MMTDKEMDKFNSAETLLDKVRVMLDDLKMPEVVYNELPGGVQTVDGIALIQCFHGTDIARIRATTQALEFNLRMTRKPSTWVFVECQRRRSDCAFGWVKNHGLKYVFVKGSPDSDGILLKGALWNVGAKSCSEPHLCFVDSDVVMCASNWMELAETEFRSGKDVLSLTSHQYYEADERCQLSESVGFKYCRDGVVENSHCGFTFGITRPALELIGWFEPTVILDDLQTWRKVMGDEVFKPFRKWTEPFELPKERELGFNLRVGYVDKSVACHIWHGEDHGKYSQLTDLLKCSGARLNSELVSYDPNSSSDLLPRWAGGSSRAAAVKSVVMSCYENQKKGELNPADNLPAFNAVAEYRTEMQRRLGRPDDEGHPLFVCSTVKDRFGLKIEDFTAFRNRVEVKFNASGVNPVVVFFTDAKMDFKSNDINAYPLGKYQADDEPAAQCMRKDVKFPKNAIVYFIPFGLSDDFNTTVWAADETTRFMDGTVLVGGLTDKVNTRKDRGR